MYNLIDTNKISEQKSNLESENYTVKIKIGIGEYYFDYGTYHNIWLDSNENYMEVFTKPSENIIIELYTGYHPGLGRRTSIYKQERTIVTGRGIIRSMKVISLNYNKVNERNKFLRTQIKFTSPILTLDYPKFLGYHNSTYMDTSLL